MILEDQPPILSRFVLPAAAKKLLSLFWVTGCRCSNANGNGEQRAPAHIVRRCRTYSLKPTAYNLAFYSSPMALRFR